MRRLNLTAAVDVNDDIGTKCLLPSSTQLLPIKWQIVYFICLCVGYYQQIADTQCSVAAVM